MAISIIKLPNNDLNKEDNFESVQLVEDKQENEIVNINEETEFKASSGVKFAQHSNNF